MKKIFLANAENLFPFPDILESKAILQHLDKI